MVAIPDVAVVAFDGSLTIDHASVIKINVMVWP
jgi:hypothetical protein